MSLAAKLREKLRDKTTELRKEIAQADGDETFYKDGKFAMALWVLEELDTLEAEEKQEKKAA